MGSDIAVNSGDTVVLGGLAQNTITDAKTKIPILGDIPFLGWFFRSTKQSKMRNEVVVFLTPRVITHDFEGEDEARNRKAYLDTAGVWRSDWSSSRLADPITDKERDELIKRALNTREPPRHTLTRELTPLNETFELEDPAEPSETPPFSPPAAVPAAQPQDQMPEPAESADPAEPAALTDPADMTDPPAAAANP